NASDDVLRDLVASGMVQRVVVGRDTPIEAPETLPNALCIVASGQIAIGVFDRAELAERGRPQRDAAIGEEDGTLMPPGPLARTAKRNLALFTTGELFNLGAIPTTGVDAIRAFALGRSEAVLIAGEAMDYLARTSPGLEQAIADALVLTNARMRAISGIKHEILDFYVRNGLSVAGPTVRVRQLDLCIDCK